MGGEGGQRGGEGWVGGEWEQPLQLTSAAGDGEARGYKETSQASCVVSFTCS